MQQISFEAADHRGIFYRFCGVLSGITPLNTPTIHTVSVKTGLGDLPITDEPTKIKILSHFTQAILDYAKGLTDKATSEA